MAALDTQLPARFWRNVDRTGSCWIWTAGRTAGGYGKCFIDGRQQYAHRVVYVDQMGAIPDGILIDHICSNKACCNPEHLRPATVRANGQHRAGAQINSRSGVRGVYRTQGRWRVQVKGPDGRIRSGGMFVSIEAAEHAAIELRAELMGEFGR